VFQRSKRSVLINDEDKLVALAVEKVLPEIAAAIDKIVERLQTGGRLFYVGNGNERAARRSRRERMPPTSAFRPN
jgi:N-acetylmuramic acid 6-phosphate etherase